MSKWFPQEQMFDYVHAFEDGHLDGRRTPDVNVVEGRLQIFY